MINKPSNWICVSILSDIRFNCPIPHKGFKTCRSQRFLVKIFPDVCACWLFLASLRLYDFNLRKQVSSCWFTTKLTFKTVRIGLVISLNGWALALYSILTVFCFPGLKKPYVFPSWNFSTFCLMQVLVFCQYINTLDMLEAHPAVGCNVWPWS